jgi:hypothetical protein
MSNGCRACRAGLEHCHGTLIDHPRSRPECTEDGCSDSAPVLHAFVVGCDAVGCGCGGAAVG